MSDNTQELREQLLRVLMTAPNNLQEKTINGKTKNVFEVQNYELILALIKSQTNQAVLEALDRVEKEVIGAIEPSYDTENPWEADKRHGANILRAEQRKKLATLRKELTQEVQTDELD